MSFLEIETPYLIKSTPEGQETLLCQARMNQADSFMRSHNLLRHLSNY